jgi:hypothetical protein
MADELMRVMGNELMSVLALLLGVVLQRCRSSQERPCRNGTALDREASPGSANMPSV